MKIREKRTISNNVKRYVDVGLCTLHFNLRSPKSITPTQLYAILYIRCKDGTSKQFKLPLYIKILPSQWDRRRETIRFDSTDSTVTKDNLHKALTVINSTRLVFLNILDIFALSSIDDKELVNKFKINISNEMNNENLKVNRGITASTVVKKAFKEMYENSSKTASTVRQQTYKLNKFLKYLKSEKVTDSARHRLSIEGLNEYRSYLHRQDKELSDARSYDHIKFIISLINHAVSNRTRDIGITNISIRGFNKTNVVRDAKIDNKHVEIKEEELEVLKSLSLSNKREQDTRDLFLFGCTIGCRYSDLLQILQKRFEIKEVYGEKILVYETQKGKSKHITAYVPFSISPIIEETIDRIRVYDFDIPNDSSYFSKILRKIFGKANLRRPITYKNAKGIQYTKDLCDVVSSHDMRVTGATQMLRQHSNSEFVVRACGWKNDKMLRDIYGRLTVDDEAKLQCKRIQKAHTSETETRAKDEITDMRDALVYLGADYADVHDITSISDLHVAVRKYENLLLDKGVDCKIVKDIYNEKIPFKERMSKLRQACNEAVNTVR